MLPEGIGVIPLFLNISEGTTAEFKRAVAPYEPLITRARRRRLRPDPSGRRAALHAARLQGRGRAIEAVGEGPTRCRSSPPARTTCARCTRSKPRRIVGATYFIGGDQRPVRKVFRRGRLRRARHGRHRRAVSTRSASSPPSKSMPTSSAPSSSTARPTRSTSSAPAGACCRSSICWSRISACRSCIRCRRDVGNPASPLSVRQPVKGYGRLLAEMLPG